MLAAWVRLTLVAKVSSPAWSALAIARLITLPVLRVTASLAHRYLAVLSLPAWNADLVSVPVTGEVAELVVPRSAEFGAGYVEVVLVTLHTDPVGYPRHLALVVEGVPLGARKDYARVACLLYQLRSHVGGVVVQVQSLKY